MVIVFIFLNIKQKHPCEKEAKVCFYEELPFSYKSHSRYWCNWLKYATISSSPCLESIVKAPHLPHKMLTIHILHRLDFASLIVRIYDSLAPKICCCCHQQPLQIICISSFFFYFCYMAPVLKPKGIYIRSSWRTQRCCRITSTSSKFMKQHTSQNFLFHSYAFSSIKDYSTNRAIELIGHASKS